MFSESFPQIAINSSSKCFVFPFFHFYPKHHFPRIYNISHNVINIFHSFFHSFSFENHPRTSHISVIHANTATFNQRTQLSVIRRTELFSKKRHILSQEKEMQEAFPLPASFHKLSPKIDFVAYALSSIPTVFPARYS